MNTSSALSRCAIVGRGRLGTALAGALERAGVAVEGPLGRGADGRGATLVLLCVPDAEIADAAAAIAPGPLVGHCSGATTLAPLAGHEAFSLHPLMTVTAAGATFAGAGAAVAGSTPHALAASIALAERLGMRPVSIADADRAAYHAAASIASNFLVTVEAAAQRLAASAGVDPALLAPLVRASVENWAALGPERALTGPVARGDEATVAHQREAVAARTPELLGLWDALVAATRELAATPAAAAPAAAPTAPAAPATAATPATAPATAATPATAPAIAATPATAPVGAGLRTVRTAAELRAALAPARRAGARIGLVPTMGALHAGHVSLIERARAESDVVVLSLFVNPAQFGPHEDLDAYPRDEARDARIAAEHGVDLLFAPAPEAIYPPGFTTHVAVDGPLTATLEGARRGASHFQGVTTVVAKLLNIAQPDVAYFGQKDAQQALVVRRMVRDLDVPVRIEVCPTVREADGLARSSRNAYLSAAERTRAPALRRGLDAAEAAIAAGERDPAAVAAAGRAAMAALDVEPDYFEIVGADTLAPVATIDGELLVAVAASVGRTHLIDNALVRAPASTRAPGVPRQPLESHQ